MTAAPILRRLEEAPDTGPQRRDMVMNKFALAFVLAAAATAAPLVPALAAPTPCAQAMKVLGK
jgi:hypothetical protein